MLWTSKTKEILRCFFTPREKSVGRDSGCLNSLLVLHCFWIRNYLLCDAMWRKVNKCISFCHIPYFSSVRKIKFLIVFDHYIPLERSIQVNKKIERDQRKMLQHIDFFFASHKIVPLDTLYIKCNKRCHLTLWRLFVCNFNFYFTPNIHTKISFFHILDENVN